MEDIIKELDRVSKYSCSCWIFGFPYQLSFIIKLMEQHNSTYRQHIVLDKKDYVVLLVDQVTN